MRTRFLLIIPMVAAIGYATYQRQPEAPRAIATPAATHSTTAVPLRAARRPSLATRDFPAFAAVLAELSNNLDEAALSEVIGRGYYALVERLQSHPEFAFELAALLAEEDVASPAARMMAGALAGAGTRESQAAMVDLLSRRSADDPFLRLLIPTMGFAAHPGDELEAALRRTAADDHRAAVRGNADLALGVIAARTSDEDPIRSKRLVATFLGRLETARDSGDISATLGVLGNAGVASSTDAIARYLDDQRPVIRASAAEALRRIPTAGAEDAIVRALSDPSDVVRAAAAWALGQRPTNARLVDVQGQVLAREVSTRVATALLSNLAVAVEQERSARTIIEQAAQTHPVDDIRASAQSVLERIPA